MAQSESRRDILEMSGTCNDEWDRNRALDGERRSACLMTVRRLSLSSWHYELSCNTITAALHISDGLGDYQRNVIIDLHLTKMGNVQEVKLCVPTSVTVLCLYPIAHISTITRRGVLSTCYLFNEVNGEKMSVLIDVRCWRYFSMFAKVISDVSRTNKYVSMFSQRQVTFIKEIKLLNCCHVMFYFSTKESKQSQGLYTIK